MNINKYELSISLMFLILNNDVSNACMFYGSVVYMCLIHAKRRMRICDLRFGCLMDVIAPLSIYVYFAWIMYH